MSQERELFIEQRRVLRLGCYKVQKFAAPAGAPLDIELKARALQRCDFGFEKIEPACKNCVWFQMQEITGPDRRPVLADRVIDRSDLPGLMVEFSNLNQVPTLPARAIAEEKAAASKPMEI